MNSTKTATIELVMGLVICLVVAGYYGYLIITNQKLPAAVPPPTAGAFTLDEPTLLDIRTKTINGNLPITVNESEVNNPQPFRQ